MRPFMITLTVLSVAFVTVPSARAGASPQRPGVHVVAPGETLWVISRTHGVTPDAIARASDLPSPDRLQVGQSLVIPAKGDPRVKVPPLGRHAVQAGDTVWSIARMHQMTPASVARLNRLPDENRIQIGTRPAPSSRDRHRRASRDANHGGERRGGEVRGVAGRLRPAGHPRPRDGVDDLVWARLEPARRSRAASAARPSDRPSGRDGKRDRAESALRGPAQ